MCRWMLREKHLKVAGLLKIPRTKETTFQQAARLEKFKLVVFYLLCNFIPLCLLTSTSQKQLRDKMKYLKCGGQH